MTIVQRITRYSPRLWATALFFIVSMGSLALSYNAMRWAEESRRISDLTLVENRPFYLNRVAAVRIITYVPDKNEPIMGQRQLLRIDYEDGTNFSTDNMAVISVMILHLPRDRTTREFIGRRS